jgi:hypothetical protein
LAVAVINVNTEQELDKLFAASRDAFPELDASPNFLPEVWAKIEARRAPGWLTLISNWSPRLALAASLAAAVLTTTAAINHQKARNIQLLESSYIDALTVSSLDEQDGSQWILAGLPR